MRLLTTWIGQILSIKTEFHWLSDSHFKIDLLSQPTQKRLHCMIKSLCSGWLTEPIPHSGVSQFAWPPSWCFTFSLFVIDWACQTAISDSYTESIVEFFQWWCHNCVITLFLINSLQTNNRGQWNVNVPLFCTHHLVHRD